jgi:hypothetical protein
MDTTQLVDGYFAMWNEPDAGARLAAVAATWTEDGTYLDPMFDTKGHEALAGMADAVRQQFPGTEFRLTGGIDAHHDRLRWAWELVPAGGGDALATGLDVAVVVDGRLWHVTGFVDAAGAAAA